MQRATARILPDGRRLHLQHGPIDLIVEAWGAGCDAGYRRAAARFAGLLQELVEELSVLRRYHIGIAPVSGPVARRMAEAVAPLARDRFVTPMAAVAGAVADEILAEVTRDPAIRRAYVNNGGDIALHLAPGESIVAAVAAAPPATVRLTAQMRAGGVATSGWRGRSHSLGIADSVTVLAGTAAAADAAATLIANAVDLPGHPGIGRRPAHLLAPDSDLGARAVTTSVPRLRPAEIDAALGAGHACARSHRARGLIRGAHLVLQGRTRSLSLAPLPSPALEISDA